MELQIRFRRCPLKSHHCEYLKKRAQRQLEQAARSLQNPLLGKMVLDSDPNGFRVDILIRSGRESLKASFTATDPRVALEGAAEKLRAQSRKTHSRRSTHRAREGRRAKEQPWFLQNLVFPSHQASYP